MMHKIINLIILSFCFILKAEDIERIAIFPFKASGIDTSNSLKFVELLRTEVSKSKQYEMMEYTAMQKILSYNGYKGDNLCYDEECAFVMGEFLSVNKIVQGFLTKKRSTFSVNIRFIDLEKEEIILDVTEHFKGSFEDLLSQKIPKFAEMINWSTRYLSTIENSKKNEKVRPPGNNEIVKKKGLRILTGITSMGAFGGGVLMNYWAEKKIERYKTIEEEYKATANNEQYKNLNEQYKDNYKSAQQRIMARNGLYILSGIGLTSFSITFFF